MSRLDRFVELLTVERLDGFLVTWGVDIRYLAGFTGSAAMLWVSPERTVFMTDFRYETQAEKEVGDKAEIHITTHDKGYIDILDELGVFAGKRYVGFDGEKVSYSLYRRLSARFSSVNFIPLRSPVAALRARKEPSEIEKIRSAARVAMEALAETLPLLRPGITEKEFAAELEYRLRRKGSEKAPFETIVASGWRAALPHGIASDKAIEAGEMVVVDFGATYDGYAADITRTFFLGEPDEKFKRIYEVVLSAQEAAIRGGKAGMTGKAIDELARSVIRDAGYGDYFGHSLGHGLGLLVHDEPRLSPKNEEPIPPDAVVTVEPGIYIPGWGGVRIEDDAVVTEKGFQLLTEQLPKKLSDIIIPVSR